MPASDPLSQRPRSATSTDRTSVATADDLPGDSHRYKRPAQAAKPAPDSPTIIHGATFVFAVNTGRTRVTYRFAGASLANAVVTVFEEHRMLRATATGFSDAFGPLAVHIYVLPPAAVG
jgi:hypothetical protein